MTHRYFSFSLAIVVVSILATAILYPSLPPQVPTHWNTQGQIDSYSAKWTLFIIVPAIMAATIALFALLPWLSPRHFEVDTFRSTYLYIMLVIIAFLGYTQALLLAAGELGHIDIRRALWGGVCLLFALLGNVMGKVRRNFYIGIRTPWTLANERVWNATHRFGARTIVTGGLAGLVLNFANAGLGITFGVVMAGVLAPVIYSLLYYKRLQRRGEI